MLLRSLLIGFGFVTFSPGLSNVGLESVATAQRKESESGQYAKQESREDSKTERVDSAKETSIQETQREADSEGRRLSERTSLSEGTRQSERTRRAGQKVELGSGGKYSLELSDFQPESRLVVPITDLTRAKFPVVDAHTHFGFKFERDPSALDGYVDLMDRNNIAINVSLDGRLGAPLKRHMKFLWTKYPNRFVIYAHLDWRGDGQRGDPKTWACNQPGFVRNVVEQLREAKKDGISGLKFFKRFGLGYRNSDGSLIKIDDPRFDPIWQVCGELGLPIIMHSGDPSAFFEPIDEHNERIEELARHPDWSFHGADFPSRDELLAARIRIVKRHRGTTFIAAHLGNDGEDLSQTKKWLDENPNLYVEFASRISELGRQPYSSRDFLIRYSDRVLFGTDGPWPEERLHLYWRFLETRDEYFPYAEYDYPPQGFWRIYGVYLDEETLQQIYYKNAARIIPGVAERLASQGIQIDVDAGNRTEPNETEASEPEPTRTESIKN